MKLQMVGCSHHDAPVEVREQIAFRPDQVVDALMKLRKRFPQTEAVLLSTCNRVELYTAVENQNRGPTKQQVVQFLADYHGIAPTNLAELLDRSDTDAVRHLFNVAASIDSMVMGEAQILAQVKDAYQLATTGNATGPLTHGAFQAAMRVAKRVASETAIHHKRISIPSVAVRDFAMQIFESLAGKQIVVLGAGEMGTETLRYVLDEGATNVTIINRDINRATELAKKFDASVAPWDELENVLVNSDFVISATGAKKFVLDIEQFECVQQRRYQRPLFLLDLAVPRNIDPRIGSCLGVYLYSIDDLRQTCQANRAARNREIPLAEKIIEEESNRFMRQLRHRVTGPTIRRLKEQADGLKNEELIRLFSRLDTLDDRHRDEIQMAFDRLVKKILHPPLESLRVESKLGTPNTLLEAVRRLFQIKDED